MTVLHIAWRELRANFHGAIGWLVLTAFVFVAGVFWVAGMNNYVMQANSLVSSPYGGAELTLSEYLIMPFFGNCTVVVLLVAPALSMRLFSEELRQRSLELLLCSPISTWEIVIGKYLGAVGLVGVMLATTLHVPISLAYWGSPDLGVLAGGYAALWVLGAAIVAMGMWFSAMTDNQIVAMVLTFACALALYLGTWMGGTPESLLVQLSLSSHLEDLLQGLVRVSDLVYFAGFIGFFLFMTVQRLESFRWR